VRAVTEGYGLQVLGTIEKPLTARRLGELLATYRPRAPAAGTSDAVAPPSAVEARAALGDGRIGFHLRPAVDVATGRVVAADAVPHWAESGGAVVPTGAFLPVLAREQLLGVLSARCVERAGALAREHADTGLEIALTVDLAPDAPHDVELAERAARTARAAGADPARLTFALDERVFRSAPGAALGALTRLRVKGFGVCLSGFGTGHATAEHLRGVPLTEAKLAPQIVTGAGRDERRVRALEQAIDVARELDVTIVGDGCEHDDDLRLLLSLGCDRVLGAFVGDAMPAEQLPDWVAAWDPDRLDVGWRG
jgi:EAL domain-containing protein (putative c-di-GMP-specific phosphodiesterase class I)